MKVKEEALKAVSRVLIYGMGRTGRSALSFFARHGKAISLYVDDPASLTEEDKQALDKYRGSWQPLAGTENLSSYSFLLKTPVIPLDKPLIQRAGKDGLEVISDIEAAWRFFGSRHLIAVTGSNGKTTTTSLISHVLNESGREAVACGNIGNPVLTAMEKSGEDSWAVIEASSFQLASVRGFHPHLAVLLNITPDHLDWHKSFESYAQAKFKIGARQEKGDLLVLNPRDPVSMAALEEGYFPGPVQLIDFSSPLADRLRRQEGWRLFGEHNVENALAAYLVLKEADLGEEEILSGFSSFQPIPHRLEWVRELDGVTYINDSKATNVDSAVKALSSFKQPIILLAGGYDKKVPFDDLFTAFEKRGKGLVLMGETAPQLKAEAERRGLGSLIRLASSMEEAVGEARQLAQAGDIVLLSPASASWDQYPSFEVRGEAFKKAVSSLH